MQIEGTPWAGGHEVVDLLPEAGIAGVADHRPFFPATGCSEFSLIERANLDDVGRNDRRGRWPLTPRFASSMETALADAAGGTGDDGDSTAKTS